MALKTNIKSKITQTPGYIATTHGNLGSLATELAKEFDVQEPILIAKSGETENPTINREGYTVAYTLDTEGNTSTNGVGYIIIWYSNNKLRSQINISTVADEYNLINTAGNNNIKNEVMLVSIIKVENYDSSIAEFSSNEKTSSIGITSFTKGTEDITTKESLNGMSINDVLVEKDKSIGEGTSAPISKNKTYIGCYADVDDDGTVDGIIFADLAISQEEKIWNLSGNTNYDNNGKYSWTAQNNLKSYCIKQRNYNGPFGKADVIAPTGTGNNRFYVMALTNFISPAYEDPTDSSKSYPAYTSYYWYKNAYGHMTSPLITSSDFGKGNENTGNMIKKWNAAGTTSGYADSPQENQDMWKHIQTIYNNGKGWFIPSRAEWTAFTGELGVNKTDGDKKNYLNLGLSGYYWSSSQRNNTDGAWYADIDHGYMNGLNVNNTYAVRLATTF